jgi:hypothetical protein
MMKKITLFIFILTVYVSNAQNNVTVDVGAAWTSYMNVFDTGGNYLFGQGGAQWTLANLKTTIGASDITLQPNYNAYAEALLADDAARAYWTNSSDGGVTAGPLGNKIMEASTFVEPGASFNGVDLTFSGNVMSNTLDAGYVATFWIKALDPDAGYADALGGSKVVTLPTSGNFTVSATGAELTSGLIVQYGFTIYGLNANPVDEAALGSVVVTETQPSKVWDFGGDPNYTSAEQIALWPVVAFNAAEATTVEKDNIFMVGDDSGDKFGQIENAGGKTWDAGTADEYNAVNRFKCNGSGESAGVYMPTHSYLYFPVTDDVDVKVWYRASGTSNDRELYITDGTALLGSSGIATTTDPFTLLASKTGAGTIYIYSANDSFNLYKIEVTGPGAADLVLGLNDKVSVVSTNIKAVGNRIFVSNVKTSTEVNIYSITGALVKSFKTNTDTDFNFKSGLWIATVKTEEGQKAVKLLTH